MLLTVKDVSRLLDLTEHTIRFYTDKGLVPSLKRDEHNKRLFDEESISWLTGIKYLKQSGMSVEDIKAYVDLCLEGHDTIEERYAIIENQRAIAQEQLKEAWERVDFMEEKARHYHEILTKKIPDDTNPGKWHKEVQST
ncbi:MerR family transcriptional regulator [Rossellomorea marisflavi]|uniref:MerR family transcriptional regulator n=1 Tax=Rossellomorea marisflavi TaxID=189381 RepID=UPI003D2F3862